MRNSGLISMLLLVVIAVVSVAVEDDAFRVRKLTGRIAAFNDALEGASQIVINTGDGLVVFNSHWSNVTASRFKNAMIEHYDTDKFGYVIIDIDRIDMFGGNDTFADSTIIGHASFPTQFTPEFVKTELDRLIKMWRWKVEVAIERNQSASWRNTCQRRADELEKSYSLRMPDKLVDDRVSISHGDVTLEIISLGKAGNNGILLTVVPEEHVAIIPGFVLHGQHLAPHPQMEYTELDVPRWISIFEEMLADERIEKFIVDTDYIWSKERVASHLKYIKTLWETVRKAKAEGKTLEEVQELCALDGDFVFVKDIQVYKDHGDDWVRPQHEAHVATYYWQP